MLFVYSYLWLLTDSMSTYLQRSRCRAQTGQGLVEYALIIGVIAVAVIGVAFIFGNQIKGIFTSVNSSLSTCVPASASNQNATCP